MYFSLHAFFVMNVSFLNVLLLQWNLRIMDMLGAQLCREVVVITDTLKERTNQIKGFITVHNTIRSHAPRPPRDQNRVWLYLGIQNGHPREHCCRS